MGAWLTARSALVSPSPLLGCGAYGASFCSPQRHAFDPTADALLLFHGHWDTYFHSVCVNQ